MAAILQLVLEEEVSPAQLVDWLLQHDSAEKNPEPLSKVECIRSEFMPYLLNYLRDQTAHLIHGCRSAAPSPAKTPSSLIKLKKKISAVEKLNADSTATSTPVMAPVKSNRVQLFATSPIDPSPSNHSKYKPTPKANTSLNLTFDSPSMNNSSAHIGFRNNSRGKPMPKASTSVSLTFDSPSLNDSATPNAGRNQSRGSSINDSLEARLHQSFGTDNKSGRSSPANNSRNDSRMAKSLNFQSPLDHNRSNPFPDARSSKHERSKHRSSLGDFLISPEPGSQIRHSPRSGRKSGGKGKNRATGEIKHARVIQFKDVGSPPAAFALNNIEEFPSLGAPGNSPQEPKVPDIPSGAKIITASRRITPTPITASSTPPATARRVFTMPVTESEPAVMHSAFKTEPLPQEQQISLEDERKKLREERDKGKLLEEFTTPSKTPMKTPSKGATPAKDSSEVTLSTITPTKYALARLLSTERQLSSEIKAERTEVTYEMELTMLAEMYSTCLSEYLVPNITIELYFLLQLLTAKGGDMELAIEIGQETEDFNFFTSVHNGVFFAVLVLSRQRKLVSLLDKGTLKLLMENPRIGEFDPDFRDHLACTQETVTSKALLYQPPSPIGGVSFQAETDNRKNFPHDRVFHHFKKQRDMFYELLREWQENHDTPNWSTQDAMGERIRILLSGRLDISNHIHFARLFQSQLVQMCKSDHNSALNKEDIGMAPLLAQLKQANPERLKRLQDRFIMPSSAGGPCPMPSFPGCQEFFRDFIYAASNHVFNHHLTDCLASQITEMNETAFPGLEGGDSADVEIDQEDREALASCLVIVRLLAKFLGFVTFLPYQTVESIPEAIQPTCISQRSQTMPPLEVIKCLEESMRTGRIIVTVPWVIEFLSMMDQLAPQLQYYQAVFELLLRIYRICCSQFRQRSGSLTMMLITISLGWFFELPVFPEGFFFQKLTHSNTVDIPVGSLDNHELVDHQILYTCCPYLGEIRSLLMGYVVGASNKGNNIRKITPISTVTDPSSTTLTEKQLQHQLEENFFHNHPASMKRTVDFVADRIASNHIKRFRNDILPALLQEGRDVVMDLLKQSKINGSPDTRQKKKMQYKMETAALKLATKGKESATSGAVSYANEKLVSLLPLLLPGDISSQVLDIVRQIASRATLEKVNTWLTMHLTKGMFARELEAEMDKQLRLLQQGKNIFETKTKPEIVSVSVADAPSPVVVTQEMVTGPTSDVTPVCHDYDCIGPADLIIIFKENLHDILSAEGHVTASKVIESLSSLQLMVSRREDVMPGVLKIICKLLIETVYGIILLQPQEWTDQLLCHCEELWTGLLRKNTNFDSVICPKHLYMLSKTDSPQIAWKIYGRLIIRLLSLQLITPEKIDEGVLKCLQQEYLMECPEKLAECVCDIAQSYHSSPGADYVPSALLESLEWLVQLCGEESFVHSHLQECLEHIHQQLLEKQVEPEVAPSSVKEELKSSPEELNSGVPPVSRLFNGPVNELLNLSMTDFSNDNVSCDIGTEKLSNTEQVSSDIAEQLTMHPTNDVAKNTSCNPMVHPHVGPASLVARSNESEVDLHSMNNNDENTADNSLNKLKKDTVMHKRVEPTCAPMRVLVSTENT